MIRFWHPNCRCYVIAIIKSEEKFWEDEDKRGNDNKTITELPENFNKWASQNKDRIARAEQRGTQPYFVRDNRERIKQAVKKGDVLRGGESSNSLSEFHNTKDFKEAQKYLSRQKYEKIVVLNSSGKKAFEIQGTSAEVSFSDEQGLRMKDKIVMHNHPYGLQFAENDLRRVGNSFSGDDVYSAVKFDMSAIIAISPRYRYELYRPSKGWGVDCETIMAEYDKMYCNLCAEYVNQIHSSRRIMMQHLTMKKLAKTYGLEYKKINIYVIFSYYLCIMEIREWFKLDSEITHMIVVLGNNDMTEEMYALDDIHSKLFSQFDLYDIGKANEEIEPYRELTKDIDPVRKLE